MSNPARRDSSRECHDGLLSRLVVNLDAVTRNYLFLKKKLGPDADCAAVVKSDAYGLGAKAVARLLFNQGCRHFFVATIDEALEVKSVLPARSSPGDDLAIYILNGLHGAPAAEFIADSLVPVLNTLPDVEYWAGEAVRANKKLPALLHIDTGMNRLGLSGSEVAALAAKPELLKALDIRYVMSHLACADDPVHPKNAEQWALFQKLAASLNRPFRYSLANSGGIFLGSDYHFDLVRPGASIYGMNVTGTSQSAMQPVVTLEGRILQTREIDRPGSVGYGAEFPISPPAKTATISVGYADGYLRSLKSRGMVFIGGEKCPVIGRVSMDCIVADTTLLKRQPEAGSFAEIIGTHHTVDDVAAEAGTIGYEILTSFGKRLKRIYEGTNL